MTVTQEIRRASECSTLTWLLVGDVREMLQDRLNPESVRWLRPLLDALHRAMCEQRRIERSPGYFDDVIAPFPHLSDQIDAVLHEEDALCEALENLRDSLDGIHPRQALQMHVQQLEGELEEWVCAMIEHARRDRELLQNVWYTEIGGEG